MGNRTSLTLLFVLSSVSVCIFSLLLAMNVNNYTSTECAYIIASKIPVGPESYLAILNVSSVLITHQQVVYGEITNDNEIEVKCYSKSCEGTNCPLLTVTIYDTNSIAFICIICISIVLFIISFGFGMKKEGEEPHTPPTYNTFRQHEPIITQ